MTEENLGWIFIDKIPLLYNEKNVERQMKIEKWLDLYQLTRELGLNGEGKTTNLRIDPSSDYIV